MAGGRPTVYNKEIGDEICELLAAGQSLNSICRQEKYPHKVTVMRWLLSDNPIYAGFRNHYAFARKIQYEFLADDIIDIADDGSNDYMEKLDQEGNTAGYILNGEHVQRSRLRVDTRKWFLAKVLARLSDRNQPTEFKFINGATPLQNAEHLMESASKGEIGTAAALNYISALKSLIEIDQATEVKTRLEEIEKALNLGGN